MKRTLVMMTFLFASVVPGQVQASTDPCSDINDFLTNATNMTAFVDKASAFSVAGNAAMACAYISPAGSSAETTAYHEAGEYYFRAARLLANTDHDAIVFAKAYSSYDAYLSALVSNKQSQVYEEKDIEDAMQTSYNLAIAYKNYI